MHFFRLKDAKTMAPQSTLRLLTVVAVLSSGAALQVKPREKDEKKADAAVVDKTDRFGHIRVSKPLTFAMAGTATVAATAAQIMKPAWLASTLGPAAEAGAGAVLLRFITWFDGLKTSSPLGLTMGHGFLLKMIAEVLAQVIPQKGGGAVWLDPLRVVRSTVASVVSASYTFYLWTRSDFFRGLRAPGWLKAVVGGGFGTSLTKMVVTQAVYRPINVFLFLVAQAFFRGDSMRGIVDVIRTKFKGGIIGGIAFFSVSNILMFSIPVPFLHPIIGALAGLIFNVWLAMVAYAKAPELPAAAPDSSLLASMPAVTEFPATSATLGALGMLEGVVAASLYSTAARVAATASGKPAMGEGFVPATPRTANAL